jgi:hypothetical protein
LNEWKAMKWNGIHFTHSLTSTLNLMCPHKNKPTEDEKTLAVFDADCAVRCKDSLALLTPMINILSPPKTYSTSAFMSSFSSFFHPRGMSECVIIN